LHRVQGSIQLGTGLLDRSIDQIQNNGILGF
jgi:hypothetical protein